MVNPTPLPLPPNKPLPCLFTALPPANFKNRPPQTPQIPIFLTRPMVLYPRSPDENPSLPLQSRPPLSGPLGKQSAHPPANGGLSFTANTSYLSFSPSLRPTCLPASPPPHRGEAVSSPRAPTSRAPFAGPLASGSGGRNPQPAKSRGLGRGQVPIIDQIIVTSPFRPPALALRVNITHYVNWPAGRQRARLVFCIL